MHNSQGTAGTNFTQPLERTIWSRIWSRGLLQVQERRRRRGTSSIIARRKGAKKERRKNETMKIMRRRERGGGQTMAPTLSMHTLSLTESHLLSHHTNIERMHAGTQTEHRHRRCKIDIHRNLDRFPSQHLQFP